MLPSNKTVKFAITLKLVVKLDKMYTHIEMAVLSDIVNPYNRYRKKNE